MEIVLAELYQTLIESASILIVAIVGVGVTWIVGLINSWVKNEKLKASIAFTMSTVESSVKSTIQKMSTDLKKAVADGSLSQEEMDKIGKDAVVFVKRQVAPEIQKRVQAHVGDLNELIRVEAEAVVQKIDKVTN